MHDRAIFISTYDVQIAKHDFFSRQPTQGKAIASTLGLAHKHLYCSACCCPCFTSIGLVTCLMMPPQAYLHMYMTTGTMKAHTKELFLNLTCCSMPGGIHQFALTRTLRHKAACSYKHGNGPAQTHFAGLALNSRKCGIHMCTLPILPVAIKTWLHRAVQCRPYLARLHASSHCLPICLTTKQWRSTGHFCCLLSCLSHVQQSEVAIPCCCNGLLPL